MGSLSFRHLIILAFFAIIVSPPIMAEENLPEQHNGKEPFSVQMVDVQPIFPGGDEAMYKWLGENIRFPSSAIDFHGHFKTVVEFVIETDGSITNAKIVRESFPMLDKEVIRVINAMPKWIPGKKDYEPVRVTYKLPIQFKCE